MAKAKDNSAVEIYTLSDPKTLKVRYVGKANDSAKRLKTHLSDSRRRKTPVCLWIRGLVASGSSPIINVISIVDESKWKEEEIRQINLHREIGFDLLNVAKGGNEPHCPKSVRAENGRKNAKALHANPKSKRLWYLKKTLATTLKYLKDEGRNEKRNSILHKLHEKGIFLHLNTIG